MLGEANTLMISVQKEEVLENGVSAAAQNHTLKDDFKC